MPLFAEASPAKINLSLKIAGKRPDGYHELESLVVFGPDAADVVILDTDRTETLDIDGPFATRLEGENILLKTLAAVRDASRSPAALGAVRLTKNLPVAAGLGGGSANAASLLRALRRAHPHLSNLIDWHAIAASLGADVPVCLESRASLMTGTGAHVTPLSHPLPEFYAVLANPRVPVPHDKTARVFRALAAPSLTTVQKGTIDAAKALTRDAIEALMRSDGNDLASPAATVIPEIGDVLASLARLPGAIGHALSGAGPTAFAVFGERTAAEAAALQLRAQHPNWWIAETRLT